MQNLRREFIEELCKSTKVTGNALKISLALMDKELTQKELCEMYKYKKSAVSINIKKLLELGVIERKQKHNSFIYSSNLSWKAKGLAKGLKILTWNINNRAKQAKEIPLFIGGDIVNRTPDIVILTEFNFIEDGEDVKKILEGWEDVKKILEENNYKLFYNEDPKAGSNNILIAIKKRKEIKFEFEKNIIIESDSKEKPDFLEVPIMFNGKIINIIGIRIRVGFGVVEEYEKRREQLDLLIEHLNNKENVLIMGDFNNSKICGDRNSTYKVVKEDYKNDRSKKSRFYDMYNYHILKDELNKNGFTLSTPKDGYSWVGNGNYKYQQDHIISKGAYIHDSYYNWDFVKIDNGYENSHDQELKPDRAGLPDHAILTAVIKIKE